MSDTDINAFESSQEDLEDIEPDSKWGSQGALHGSLSSLLKQRHNTETTQSHAQQLIQSIIAPNSASQKLSKRAKLAIQETNRNLKRTLKSKQIMQPKKGKTGKTGKTNGNINKVSKTVSKTFLVGTIAILPYGVIRAGAAEAEADSDSDGNDHMSDDNSGLPAFRLPPNHRAFPHVAALAGLCEKGLASTSPRGFEFSTDWDFNEVEKALHKYLPHVFDYFSTLPDEKNFDDITSHDHRCKAQWLLCWKDRFKAVVVPGIPFPTGLDILRFTHKANKAGFTECVLLLTTRHKISAHDLKCIAFSSRTPDIGSSGSYRKRKYAAPVHVNVDADAGTKHTPLPTSSKVTAKPLFIKDDQNNSSDDDDTNFSAYGMSSSPPAKRVKRDFSSPPPATQARPVKTYQTKRHSVVSVHSCSSPHIEAPPPGQSIRARTATPEQEELSSLYESFSLDPSLNNPWDKDASFTFD